MNEVIVFVYDQKEVDWYVNNIGNKYFANYFKPFAQNLFIDMSFTFSDMNIIKGGFSNITGCNLPDRKCMINYVFEILKQPVKRILFDVNTSKQLIFAHVIF